MMILTDNVRNCKDYLNFFSENILSALLFTVRCFCSGILIIFLFTLAIPGNRCYNIMQCTQENRSWTLYQSMALLWHREGTKTGR